MLNASKHAKMLWQPRDLVKAKPEVAGGPNIPHRLLQSGSFLAGSGPVSEQWPNGAAREEIEATLPGATSDYASFPHQRRWTDIGARSRWQGKKFPHDIVQLGRPA